MTTLPTLEIFRLAALPPAKGVTCVFVHGANFQAAAWTDRVLPFFAARGFDCVAPSLRGHGKSELPCPLRKLKIRDYVEDVRGVIAASTGPVILIGHSMGGFIVQHILQDPPASLMGALLITPAPAWGIWRVPLKELREAPLDFLKMNLTQSLYTAFDTPAKSRRKLYSSRLSEEQVLKNFPLLQDESFRAFLDMLVLDLPSRARIRKAGIPVCVVAAENDWFFPPRDMEKLARDLGATYRLFDDQPHNLFQEDDWEQSVSFMADWCAEISTP